MSYPKEWKSLEEQIALLKSRGLSISNDEKATEYLERIGYYRLSGYFYAMRELSGECIELQNFKKPKNAKVKKIVMDDFKAGASFENAVDLYIFDKKLRLLAMDALERIEISVRADIAYALGKLNKFAYLESGCLHEKFCSELDKKTGLSSHCTWLSKHAQLISRSKEEFVKHNREKYGLPLAIWVACEVWDFGTMSTLFGGMKEREQDEIAQKYGLENGRVFATWLRSLNYLRNVCAHHSRLWNRNIIDQPKLPSATQLSWVRLFEHDVHARARCFLLLFICNHMVKKINPNSTWSVQMKKHLDAFPALSHIGLNLRGMGEPESWRDCWQIENV